MSILSVFMIVFQRSHCDISDINTSYDYDYDIVMPLVGTKP